MGAKAQKIDKYKLLYYGVTRARNGVGILIDKELVDQVVQVRCTSDRII